jgi:hypothetical protein
MLMRARSSCGPRDGGIASFVRQPAVSTKYFDGVWISHTHPVLNVGNGAVPGAIQDTAGEWPVELLAIIPLSRKREARTCTFAKTGWLFSARLR